MNVMKSLTIFALLSLLAVPTLGCDSSGGGGRLEKICEDYCERLHPECLEIPDGEDICVSTCVSDIEEAEEFDGKDCSEAQMDTFECVAELDDCADVFIFVNLSEADRPLPFCTLAIEEAVTECPVSIDLP